VTAYESGIPDEAAYFASGGYDSEEAAREAWTNLEGAITSGDTYEHTFEVPGTYHYFCIPHERGGMVGTVTVK
jgi:plastocyanin